ncbi:DoxX family protein [Solirubrobacter soli]|uniref:DoxX family protein n=1 Tax=Solirubrobacter soli TaxID=363832 RepID=UPI00040756DF|nr:DoxX family protein [Solirubrobacter soli]
MSFGIAILRAVVGGLFIGHGLQKLLGKFGGHGLAGTAGFFESLGLRPGKMHATAAGAAEAGGGALLLAGAATPLGAAAVTGTMTVAIKTVHAPKGPWVTEGGYEYNLVLMASVFAITAAGPGAFAIDRRQWGTAWAVAQLAAGVGGGLAMVKFARSQPERTGRFTREAEPAVSESIAH